MAIKLMTNERFLQGLGSHSIHNEKFEFNLDSEDEEDEVFIGDNVCFKEKCQSAVVNDLCDFEPLAELTDEQWAHMKEQADFLVFLLWEDKKKLSNSPAAVATAPSNRNIIPSPQITSSPAMNTRSKRKMQLISNSPYKVSPLKDITNRSTIKPSPGIITPQSIKKLASSKLDTSTDMILYEQLGLVNPVRLNFDDVEHSPKKNRCLDPCFTSQDSPLITDEACWDVLVSSPDVKQTKAVRESLGLNQSKAVRESLGLNQSKAVRESLGLNQSKAVRESLGLNQSKAVRESLGLNQSKAVRESLGLNQSKAVRESLGLNQGKAVRESLGLNQGKAVRESLGLNQGKAVRESLGLNRGKAVRESLGLNQGKTVRESLGLNPRMSLDAKLKSRIRSKTVTLDGGSSILPSRPSISSSNAKESKISSKKEKSCEPKLKSPRKSILNVSFTIDKNSEALLGIATPPDMSSENVASSLGTKDEPTLNRSFAINKSQCRDSLNEKPALNESFTINKSYICDSAGGRPSLNESFTINKSIVRDSLIGKSTLNESFTVNDSSTRKSMDGKSTLNESFTVNDSSTRNSMNRKSTLNESFTINDSSRNSMDGKSTLNESFTVNDLSTCNSMKGKSTSNESSTINKSIEQDSMNEKSALNESFTIENPHVEQSVDEQLALNESFTIDDSQSVKPPIGKPVLNESFTNNKSQLGEVINEKSSMNESFTLEGSSQTTEVLTKKPVLNESFTLEKSTLNASFTVDSSIDNSLDKSSKVEGTTSKKSLPEKPNSSINKSITCGKSSRKRTLGTPTRQGAEPPCKTTVVSRSELNKRQVPTIKSSIGPKPTMSRLNPSKTKFAMNRPDLAFDVSTSTLLKDKHGMVKFEEKSMVPAKKPKSNLLLPNKLTRKSLKVSPQKLVPKKEEPKIQSPVLRPKRKCIQSTPPISKIGSIKPAESSSNGNTDVPKTRLVLPGKLSSNIGKPMSQSRIPNKGPLRAFPTLSKGSEMKPSEGSHLPLAGKSKLRMPSPVKSRIPYMNFKHT